ncbi:MAG: redoxin domain-containing protein [Planctomycetota bacterium]
MIGHYRPFRADHAWTVACVVAMACSVISSGCSDPKLNKVDSSESAPVGDPLPSQADAESLLQKVRNVYATATTYTDNATVVFYGVPKATGTERIVPFTESYLAFERPNLLHVSYTKNIASPQEEDYEIVSDGLTVRSSANELPDQLHEAVAPVWLTVENFIPEPALRRAVLENAIENTFPQLAMLLSTDSERELFPGENRFRQLTDDEIEGDSFHRLEWSGAAGKRVLWIDPAQYSIRRMQIPIESQRKLLDPRKEYSTVSVWIDFAGVEIDADIDPKVFKFAVPDGARRVRRFIPSPPAPPPEYLGKPIGDFAFRTLTGETVTPESLRGKVALLDFWTTKCPPCRAQTPVLNDVYQQFRESDDFAFIAVSLDSRVVPNEAVAKTLVSWGGEMPVVRDRDSTSVSLLNIRNTPSLMAIDREGRVQSFQVGAHRSPDALIDLVQRMMDGEDLIATDRQQHAEFVAKYDAALDAAEIRGSLVETEAGRREVPARKLPTKLRLTQLWQTDQQAISRPDALLVTGQDERILVLDDGQAIVELDVDGEVLARHALPDHPERADGFLRSWSNDQGERWTLASGAGWQQVYVFDQNWQQVLAFPDDKHSGIGDVLFDDLTGSGTPVMHVGYWGGLGVQGGTLDARQLWSNRRLDHVFQLANGPTQVASDGADDSVAGRRTLWCTSTRGTLLQLGGDGKSVKERYVPGQAIVYAATQSDGQMSCGMAVRGTGEYTVVGFDNADRVEWEYALPTGEYTDHLPRITSVVMPDGAPAWLVAAANGSLHWLDLSGRLLARCDYGDLLTGISMQSMQGKSILLVSTAQGVTAWQVESSATEAEGDESSDSETSTQSDEQSADEL